MVDVIDIYAAPAGPNPPTLRYGLRRQVHDRGRSEVDRDVPTRALTPGRSPASKSPRTKVGGAGYHLHDGDLHLVTLRASCVAPQKCVRQDTTRVAAPTVRTVGFRQSRCINRNDKE